METSDNVTLGSGLGNETADFKPLPFISRFFLVFVSLMIVISNAVVLAVLGRMRSSLTKMQLFLQSLAVADLLVGLMWFVLNLESIFARDLYVMSNWLCLLVIHLPAVALSVSVLTLGLISVERYIAVIRPFRYHKLITRPRAKCAVVSIWLISIALFLPVYLALLFTAEDRPERTCDSDIMDVFYTYFYILTITIIPNVFLSLYCYTSIIRNIVRRDRLLSNHRSSVRSGRRYSEWTLAKIAISVYSGFHIMWLPFVVVSFFGYVGVVEVSQVVYYSTLNVGLWNCLLNCLIYSISHKPFRDELKLLVLSAACCCCCCCCIKKSRRRKTHKEPWHVMAFRSPQHRKPQLRTISSNLAKDSEANFDMISRNGHTSMEIQNNI